MERFGPHVSFYWHTVKHKDVSGCLADYTPLYHQFPQSQIIPSDGMCHLQPQDRVSSHRTHQKMFCTGTHCKSMSIFSFFTLFFLPLQMTEFRGFQPKTPFCWYEWHGLPKLEHADWRNSRHRSQLLWKHLTKIFRWVQFLTFSPLLAVRISA